MKDFLKIALASLVIAAPLASAQAQNFFPREQQQRDWRDHRSGTWGGQHRGPDRYPRGWGPNRRPDGAGYYRGYRGYRDYRPGYRRNRDGMWYPAAAFALGAILGGALSQ